ncbi:enoyl-CoA hydratase/isomerase family protein [Streptomyces sp. CG1]|uniref:enoyl-CoA hydratase/isomerase family protein n=1 Tax=Streptomyces sp. CG1 TaxID=1287523 RepID=UPI0034E2CE82
MTALPLTTLPAGAVRRTLRTHREGPVLTIELNNPEQGNAVTDDLLDDLLAVLQDQDPAVRVLVLAGSGDDFCLGGDRSEFTRQLAHDPLGSDIRMTGIKARRVCDALTTNPAVTIARVHGKAIGAGFALALACDLRVGSEDATFRLPELALGLPTAWGGLLPRLISEVGAAHVREIVLTGRAVTAAEAQSLSILQRVVPAQELDAAVAAWARPIVRRPQSALRVTKTLLNSLSSASRLADVSALDAELMAAVVTEAHHGRSAY